MTHYSVKGPHTATDLKKLDDEREKSTDKNKNERNPWILKDEPKNPQIIREIIGRVMEVNTVNLFGNFAYEFGGDIFELQSLAVVSCARCACCAIA